MSDVAAAGFYSVPIAFHANVSVFGDMLRFGSNMTDLIVGQRSNLELLLEGSWKTTGSSPGDHFVMGAPSSNSVVRNTPVRPDLRQRVFDSGVEMKVAVSQYAMHLSPETRQKLFHDLDEVINVEDWYEEDTLPRYDSFRDFLKWTIYSKRFNWVSIGVSDEGNILVAWKSQHALLTANFDGRSRVLWTAKRTSPQGDAHTAGDSPLQFFEKEATLYLD
jgi:hypothetical protein